MRMLYLTLALFVLLGIGTTCRSPGLVALDCAAAPCPPTANAGRE